MDINGLTNRTILRVLTVTALFIGAIWLAFALQRELVLVGVAIFLAIAINPLVERLANVMPRNNRSLAAITVAILVLLLFVLATSLVITPLINQTHTLVRDLPHYITSLENSGSLLGQLLNASGLTEPLKAHPEHLVGAVFSRSDSVIRVLRSFFTSVVYVLTVFTLVVFMLIEGPSWLKRFWMYQPKARRPHIQHLAEQMYQVIVRYVTVNLLFGILGGLLAAILLFIFRIPYAIPLSLVVGVTELIPIVGAVIGVSLVVLVCLLNQAFDAALLITVFFIIYQHVKGNFLHPFILGRTIALSPLMIFISVIFGVALAGVVGALVAIPIGGCLQILLKDYLQHHQINRS